MGWFKKRNYTSESDPYKNKSWTGYDPRLGTVIKAESLEEFLDRKSREERAQKIDAHLRDMYTFAENYKINNMTRQDYITAIRNGEYAVEADSWEDLRSIMKECFPKCNTVGMPYDFDNVYSFYRNSYKPEYWTVDNELKLKSIKASTLANMKDETKIITPDQAQRIIDIACTTWKPKLSRQWAESIVLKKSIEVHHAFYDVMRSACTPEQHKLFDDIFGPEFKVGDLVVPDNIKPEQVFKIEGISSGYNHIESLSPGRTKCVASVMSRNLRHATPEEIRAVQYPPDGTPCWVWDKYEWKLRYANGDGKFYRDQQKHGAVLTFEKSMPFDPNNLPFNTFVTP